MSGRKYIVLRKQNLIANAGNIVTPSSTNYSEFAVRSDQSFDTSATTIFDIQELSLNENEVNDLNQDPTVSIRESMPLKLISPETSTSDIDENAEKTWGVEAVGATESNFDGSGIKVGVLDTGIDINHEAFNGVSFTRKNFTTETDDDVNGHGTHCAGTIFGRDVNGKRIGVAPGVTEAFIGKVLGQGGGSSGQLADAIKWCAENGANVISMSLGIDFPGHVKELVEDYNIPIEAATSRALQAYQANVSLFSELISYLNVRSRYSSGLCFIGASGNESNRNNYTVAVAPPAAGEGIVSVGALQEGMNGYEVAYFSNTQCNISAPGVDVESAKVGGGLLSLNGTSMAAPHVAGIAALWAQHDKQQNGSITSDGLRARLLGKATREGLNPDSKTEDVGIGIVQAP